MISHNTSFSIVNAVGNKLENTELPTTRLPHISFSEKQLNSHLISLGISEITEQANTDSSTKNIAHFAKFANRKSDEESDARLSKLPSIPAEIYSKLPNLLQTSCVVFEDERQKDVYLTSGLAVLSGCMPSIYGTYDDKTVYANINSFVVAPPASGKGALAFAKSLGQKYHDEVTKESRKQISAYNKENKGRKEQQENGEKPKLKLLYIPGNISAAALIKNLEGNDGRGILCETEADTITNSLKQDWGGFSDLIRKAFQHEPISLSRKTNDEFLDIPLPKLSIAISGTPSQVNGLIKSVDDGLFSRFIFYTFKSNAEWKDVSPVAGRPNLTDYFSKVSDGVSSMIKFHDKYPAEFKLHPDQFKELNTYFKEVLSKLNLLVGEDIIGTIKRHGLIAFRIAMILSGIRKYETLDTSNCMTCSDDDFKTAMALTEVYLQHSIYMMSCLPKASKVKSAGANILYENLPTTFSRQEAVSIGEKHQIKSRTTDKYLKDLVTAKLIDSNSYGKYTKI